MWYIVSQILHTFTISRYSGILSAYGLALADVVHEVQEPCCKQYAGEDLFDIFANIHV